MSTQQADVGGLSKAHLRIVRLLDDLDSTVESVEELSRSGQHEEALRLVEQQRAALFQMVESISRDVATQPPVTLWSRVRKHGMALVAASLLLLSSLAVSAGIIGGHGPALEEGGGTSPESVDRGTLAPAVDPSTLAPVPDTIAPAVVPMRSAPEDPFDDLGPGDVTPPKPPDDPGLVEDATQIAEDVATGGGAPPPQSGENPVSTLQDFANPKDWGSAKN